MTLYRALTKLSGVCQRGDLTTLAHLTPEKVALLVSRGAVAPVAAPPLAALPGWTSRAGKLAKVGIEDAVQFVQGDPALLARVLHVKAETIDRYRESLLDLMTIRERTSEF